ncbi:hypothetical protein WMY93_032408 [Mugilogobius chulae]|uniref:Uncharacterized protein n=1 Tax=Mugilogobius chulae TaxID=88201 RepID=A0AAW0MWF4_9GOBI
MRKTRNLLDIPAGLSELWPLWREREIRLMLRPNTSKLLKPKPDAMLTTVRIVSSIRKKLGEGGCMLPITAPLNHKSFLTARKTRRGRRRRRTPTFEASTDTSDTQIQTVKGGPSPGSKTMNTSWSGRQIKEGPPSYGDRLYKQIKGTAMGASYAPNYAGLYLGLWEERLSRTTARFSRLS